jgi:hypothetical protein
LFILFLALAAVLALGLFDSAKNESKMNLKKHQRDPCRWEDSNLWRPLYIFSESSSNILGVATKATTAYFIRI